MKMHIKLVFACAMRAQAERSVSTATSAADRQQSAEAEKTAASRQTNAARQNMVMAMRRRVVHGERKRSGAQHSANVDLRKAPCRSQRRGVCSHRSRSTASNEYLVWGGERSWADTCVSVRCSATCAVARSSAIPWRCRLRCSGPERAGYPHTIVAECGWHKPRSPKRRRDAAGSCVAERRNGA